MKINVKFITMVLCTALCIHSVGASSPTLRAEDSVPSKSPVSTASAIRTSLKYSGDTIQVGDHAYRTIRKNEKNQYETIIYGSGKISATNFNVSGNLIIEDGIKEIADHVFDSCKMKRVKLPNTLQKIGKYAFRLCTNLKEITIPNSVTFIGKDILSDCSNLRKIVNHSTVSVPSPRKIRVSYMGYDYIVQGKKVQTITPNSEIVGSPKKMKMTLIPNNGIIKGKNIQTHTFGKNPTLPKASKKGYAFIGWSEKKYQSNGISKLWRDGNSHAIDQKRYAQFAKVSIKGGKKSVRIQCSNFNASEFIVYYSTKKNRSDEKSFGIYEHNKKLQALTPEGYSHKRISLKGTTKHFKKHPEKSYIDVTIPKLESKKKYYIRLKYWDIYGSEDDNTTFGESNFFGDNSVKTK